MCVRPIADVRRPAIRDGDVPERRFGRPRLRRFGARRVNIMGSLVVRRMESALWPLQHWRAGGRMIGATQ